MWSRLFLLASSFEEWWTELLLRAFYSRHTTEGYLELCLSIVPETRNSRGRRRANRAVVVYWLLWRWWDYRGYERRWHVRYRVLPWWNVREHDPWLFVWYSSLYEFNVLGGELSFSVRHFPRLVEVLCRIRTFQLDRTGVWIVRSFCHHVANLLNQ